MNKLKIIIEGYPKVEKDVDKILDELKKYELSSMKDMLKHLESLLKDKAD